MMKGWEAVFGTKDREEVARELTEDQMEHSWGENDSLRIVNRVPAIEKHPQSGHKVWFNHLMVCIVVVAWPWLVVLYHHGNSLHNQCMHISGNSRSYINW